MTTKYGCGGFSGLPVTADIGKQPGRARPAPMGVAAGEAAMFFNIGGVPCGKLLQFVPYYNSIKTTHLK